MGTALVTGLISVAAALLGSVTTYWFQTRTQERARDFEREQRRRQEQMDACSAFAAAAQELKEAFVGVWFEAAQEAVDEREWRMRAGGVSKAGAEVDRLAPAARIARFRLQLVSGDPELIALAETVHAKAGAVLQGSDRTDLRSRETQFEQAVESFIQTASERFR